MTKHEAYKEMDELEDRQFSWDRAAIRARGLASPRLFGLTPYQNAVRNRRIDLYNYWRRNGPMPIPRHEWEATCPPRDVEETAENWFRNNYPKTWPGKMRAANGEIPGFNGRYPDFDQYKDAKPLL